MSKDDKGFLAGILGGLVVSLFNPISKDNQKEKTNFNNINIFESFSCSVYRKNDGYKLKYDIDESKIKPKTIRSTKNGKYVYKLRVENTKKEDSIKTLKPKTSWISVRSKTKSMLKNTIFNGIFIVENIEPKFWVYGKKETNNHVKIIITDNKIKENLYEDINIRYDNRFCDDYGCLELGEAIELAKEMKRYYHKYVERVEILERLQKKIISINNNCDYMIKDITPEFNSIIDMLKDINKFKYDEIVKLLEKTKFTGQLSLIYTLFSLGMQLYEDNYYKHSIMVFESILKVDENVLNKTGLEYNIYETLTSLYINLKDEKKLIDLINNRDENNKYSHNNISSLANKLYELNLYDSANNAYNIIIESIDQGFKPRSSNDLFKVYLRTGNDKGMKNLRKKVVKEGKDTFYIDRYFQDKDKEGLSAKISCFEKKENWDKVINYCNKYIQLILEKHWDKTDDMLDNNIKKINAYIQLDKFKEAWITTCKFRRILISNFNGINYFEYLSIAEKYMADICLEQDYYIDTIYHYILSIIYKDLFVFYMEKNKVYPKWNTDLFLTDIIRENNINDWWRKCENIIIDEYKNLSGKSPKNVSLYMISTLEKNDCIMELKGPKKLFTLVIDTDFKML